MKPLYVEKMYTDNIETQVAEPNPSMPMSKGQATVLETISNLSSSYPALSDGGNDYTDTPFEGIVGGLSDNSLLIALIIVTIMVVLVCVCKVNIELPTCTPTLAIIMAAVGSMLYFYK